MAVTIRQDRVVLRHHLSDGLVEFLWPDGSELVTIRGDAKTISTTPQEAEEIFRALLNAGAY
jgi:hypothetical protein